MSRRPVDPRDPRYGYREMRAVYGAPPPPRRKCETCETVTSDRHCFSCSMVAGECVELGEAIQRFLFRTGVRDMENRLRHGALVTGEGEALAKLVELALKAEPKRRKT